MKAFVVGRYGSKDGLQMRDMPEPGIGPHDVLVAVRAASVNLLDAKIRDGQFRRILPYRVPFVLGNDIHAEVHSVDHVDIGVPGRAEHDLRSFREPLGRMGGEIMRSEVCLDLHDPADAFHAVRSMDQILSEQLSRNDDGVPIIKWTCQFFHKSLGTNIIAYLYDFDNGFLVVRNLESSARGHRGG